MSTLFSIKVHHGGEFNTGPNKAYVGGRIDDVDGLDSDLMSLHELDSIAHYLGYGPPVAFHFRVPGLSLDMGLVTMNMSSLLSMTGKSVQSSAGDGGSSSGVGRGRGKGTTTVVGRGRGRSRGRGTSTGMGRGRETTSELERGTTSELERGTIRVQGRRSTKEQRRGRGTTNGLGSQITEDTGVECQFQATMVRTRGGGTAFLGRGGRIQWRGHEVNVPSNYAQATQSSQTAVGSNKSTTKCIFKGQKFGNLAAI
ncbi:hypothetical protein RHGRI_008222 [Rhododendron griersonianum]|uniref:PB1-like domain-containing protein n=1 Tax=Rhododendron griersonianum TaxID=479676 RepID=A0AAV6KZK1_9ERIC|nr:hypothetical protein RHGRI_008222 [Rhododendron griersonianum]